MSSVPPPGRYRHGGSGGPDRHTTWLTTLDPDGSPHVTAVGSLWADGSFWFQTGRTTRKGRDLLRDPRCTVARRAAAWAAGGWPCEVDESGTALTAPFSAPSAGPPPWSVYRVVAQSAAAVATVAPGGATRWTF
ncbi:pyridoxamine 5'-phosphate oxidase family protein [Pseudonocardia nematodicida]|uniref:Pyridoxamine 5'-phosphate oxidase family protein n=1 Tax=Pseudonocardia nematodicida TaxID=1206997 RepID=A0ABV1K402_9PSEU